MADTATARLRLPLLFAGQSLKEMFHNQALAQIDLLVQPVIQSADLSAPQSSPNAGECWIVGGAATAEWAGHTGEIAGWASGWLFLTPAEGWQAHVLDRGHMMRFEGAGWVDGALRADGIYVSGDRVAGERQGAIPDALGGATIDAEARATIAEILSAMRAHGLIATAG